jgi:hypothetical protein
MISFKSSFLALFLPSLCPFYTLISFPPFLLFDHPVIIYLLLSAFSLSLSFPYFLPSQTCCNRRAVIKICQAVCYITWTFFVRVQASMKTGKYFMQSDQKVMQPILDTCSICQKINDTEIRKQIQYYNKCWKCALYSLMHAFTLFLMFDANR